MSKFWSPVVHSLVPYVPGEQPKQSHLIKLNTNENPYGPSPHVLEAIRTATDDTLRLYPDPNADRLRATIASYHRLAPENVFVGNGSDEILAFTFQALLNHGAPLLFPDITYSFYPVYCALYGIAYHLVPLDDTLSIRIGDYQRPCGGIILPNPNAPTGIGLPVSALETLAAEHPDQVVVVDEAYIDFGGETAIPLIKHRPNLLVIQTLSKARSLAGMRIGLALGQAPLIEALNRVKNSFNSYPLDRLALVAATAAYEDENYFQQTRTAVMRARDELIFRLRDLGFEVLPSQANFIFVRHPDHEAQTLMNGLRERAIIVRHFRKPRIEQFLRISIGTPENCATLADTLAELIQG